MNKRLLTALLVWMVPCAAFAQAPAQFPTEVPALAEAQRTEIESLARDIERAVLAADTASYVALLEPIFVAFDAPIRVRPPWRWSALVDLVGGLTPGDRRPLPVQRLEQPRRVLAVNGPLQQHVDGCRRLVHVSVP